METSANKPLMRCRKSFRCRQNWELVLFQDKFGGNLSTAQAAAGIKVA
ncbi:MAG: hypothetical protein HKP41_13080 [Desulfobacterales bacterium]|nr:hypothetical protein [Desulfobacterales bacterium]